MRFEVETLEVGRALKPTSTVEPTVVTDSIEELQNILLEWNIYCRKLPNEPCKDRGGVNRET